MKKDLSVTSKELNKMADRYKARYKTACLDLTMTIMIKLLPRVLSPIELEDFLLHIKPKLLNDGFPKPLINRLFRKIQKEV